MTTSKKASSPLDIMLQNSDNIPTVQKSLSKINVNSEIAAQAVQKKDINKDNPDNVIEIDSNNIKVWDLKDTRSESEKSKRKLDDLINRIKLYGQTVPCIVRKSDDPRFKFELIAGRRRFLAAQQLGIKLKVLVVNVKDDWEALIKQNEENERENPTDYERGCFYQNLISKGKFTTQAEIARFFSKDRQDVSRALTYFKLPKELHDAIGDFDNVTSNTAEALVSLSLKSEDHLKALISLAETIKEGKGHSTIKKLVDNVLKKGNEKRESFAAKKVVDSGRHLLTWKADQNNNISISFPAKISNILPQQDIEIALINILNKHLTNLMLSAGGQHINKVSAGGQMGDEMP